MLNNVSTAHEAHSYTMDMNITVLHVDTTLQNKK